MKKQPRQLGLTTRPSGSWVQTELAAHELWAQLAIKHPRASSVLHVLLAQMGRGNAVVASQKTLAQLAGCSVRTVQTALGILREGNWIEVRQIGSTGTANAYIINDRVAWYGNRDGMRYSLFSATVVVSADEQPDREQLGKQAPLKHIPEMYPGERQLPSGDGMSPPSQPFLPDMVPNLPSKPLPHVPESDSE